MVYFFDMGTYSGPAPGTQETNRPKADTPQTHKSRWWVWLLLLGVAAAAGYRFYLYPQVRAGDSKSEKAEKSPGKGRAQTVPVVATTARRGELPIYLTGLGSV